MISTPLRQRGIALLTAVILTALAAVLATGILFNSTMAWRRGTAAFSVEQGLQFAAGAEAWASDQLRKDLQGTNLQDSFIDDWAKPIPPVEIAEGIALEAAIDDQSGKFNLNNLVDHDGKIDEDAVKELKSLLEFLDIETWWADKLADWIDADDQAYGRGGEDSLYQSQAPPYLAANLPITSITELLQLPEFGTTRYQKLAQYVAALPPGTKLNLCTADPIVLNAMYSGIIGQQQDMGFGQNAPTQRKTTCFPTVAFYKAAATGLDAAQQASLDKRIAETSDYFRLSSWVSIGTTRFALYSLIYRETATRQVRPILRTYGTD